MTDVEISVVVPAYNESDNLPALVDRLLTAMGALACTCEIILVNDGSRDNTAEVADALAIQHAVVKVLHFSRNFGKEAALAAGMDVAVGRGVLFMDADLQHPPELMVQMVTAWREGAQVVNAVKRSRGDESALYRICSRLFNWGMSAAISGDMAGSSDYKLLDRSVIQALLECSERVRFFRGLVAWVGFVQVNIEFDVAQRHAGEPSWPLRSLLRYTLHNLLAFSSAPLYWLALVGLVMSALSCVLLVQTLYNYLMGLSAPGFTTIISLQIILSGVILFALGVIAVYIAMIYTEIKRRPTYVINKRVS